MESSKQPNWDEWQSSEYLQLDQYFEQGMFGIPQLVDENAAVFHTVWAYAIKALDGRKKARFACDGLPRMLIVWIRQALVCFMR